MELAGLAVADAEADAVEAHQGVLPQAIPNPMAALVGSELMNQAMKVVGVVEIVVADAQIVLADVKDVLETALEIAPDVVAVVVVVELVRDYVIMDALEMPILMLIID